MRDVLRSAHEAAMEREHAQREAEAENGDMHHEVEGNNSAADVARPDSRCSWASSSVATSTRAPRWADDPGKVEEERRASEMMRRKELALESARTLDVDLGILGLGARGTPKVSRHMTRFGRASTDKRSLRAC